MADGGPAEGAGLVYNASRVISIESAIYRLFTHRFQHCLAARRAGRIQSLRAFRQAGTKEIGNGKWEISSYDPKMAEDDRK